MSQSNDFRAFLEDHVNLGQTRLNRLTGSVQAITNFLSGDEVISESFKDVIPQGSFAHGTIIKPVGSREYDADVLLHLLEVPGWTAKDYVTNLHAAFGRSPIYASKRQWHTRAIRVDYAGDFHIDVVPFVTRGDGLTYICNRTTDEFERSEPDTFSAWLDAQNRITKGNLVKVVRLLKYLRDHKGTYKVPSVVLTALLGHQVSETALVLDSSAYTGVAGTLRTLSTAVSKHLDPWTTTSPYIKDPGTSDDLSKRWLDEHYTVFRARFSRHAELIADAYETEKYSDALKKWQALFGPEFGEVVAKSALAREVAAGRLTAAGGPPLSERQIENYGYRKALDARYDCTVTGYLLPTTGFTKHPLPQRGNQVPKGRSVEFRVTTTVPAPYQVYWKVRNYGEEARQAESLRGDIHQDDGSQRRQESTAYRGKHYVEAYVIKNGVCVARDRQYVIVGSSASAGG